MDIIEKCKTVSDLPHMIAVWYVKDGKLYLDRYYNGFPILDLGTALDLLTSDLEKMIEAQQ